MYLIFFCIIISYTILLPIDNPHDLPVDIGITIETIPVRLNVIEFDVVAIITIVSIDFIIVVNILYFLYFFLDLLFLSFVVCNHFFNVVDMVIETIYIIYFFLVVLNQCYQVVQMGVIYPFFGPYI